MATYYWVGGSATWDTLNAAPWSLTPTGSGGAGVPTSVDDVVFGTGTYTVTISGTVVCKSLTASTGKTFAGAELVIYGSFSLTAGVVWNVITLTFASTVSGNTINAPVTLGDVNFNGLAGVWTLTAALTCSNILVQLGEFNTGNFAVTALSIGSTANPPAGQIRTITLGTSNVILSSDVPWNFTDINDLVVNAASSVITCISQSPQFDLAGETYGTLNFTNGTAGANTFKRSGTVINLNIAPPDSPGTTFVTLLGTLTVSGTLSVAGTTTTNRIAFRGGNQTQHVLNVSAWNPAIPDNVDFQLIQWQGTPSPLNLSTVNCGDLGGNNFITFRAGRTVYWNLAGNQSWAATGWALTSGGTPNAANFPLGQDSVVFNNAGAITSVNVNDEFFVNNVDMSGRTSAMIFATNSPSKQLNVLGNWTTGTGVSFSTGAGGINFGSPSSTSTITTNGKPFGTSQYLAFSGGTTLADSLTVGGKVYLNGGVPNLNGKTLTCGGVLIGPDVVSGVINATTTNSAIVLTGVGTIWGDTVSFTTNTWAANFTITCNSVGSQIFATGASPTGYPPIIQAGVGLLSFTTSGTATTLASLSNTVYPTALRFQAGKYFTISTTFNVAGQVGNLVTIDSGTPGTAATLVKTTGTVAGSYLAIKDSTATGGATWNANNSLNNGNNTGWIFTAPPPAAGGNFFQLF